MPVAPFSTVAMCPSIYSSRCPALSSPADALVAAAALSSSQLFTHLDPSFLPSQNKSSRLTNFEVSSGAWQIDGTGAILSQLNEGSVFSFEFEVNGVTFVGNYDGLDLHDTQRCTIVSSTGCTQKIDITNRHPAVMQWGSEDNSDTVVGDNYFVGNFRDNAQHSLVNKFSIIQNAEGLVDVRGEILVPTVDFRSAVIVPFRVDGQYRGDMERRAH